MRSIRLHLELTGLQNHIHCGFSALVRGAFIMRNPGVNFTRKVGRRTMKRLALAVALVVAGLSLGGCFVGKGKAPAPVITKG
jgi:hypothetical protein